MERQLDRLTTHTVTVTGTLAGAPVTRTATYTPRIDGDDHPLVV